MGFMRRNRGQFGLWAAAVVALTSLAGCRVQTDLGTPCTLVRRDPADTNEADGINSIPILESEVTTGGPDGRDYISFGATECEDLVCVRDRDFKSTRDPGSAAEGYCSRACEPQLPNQCPAANEADESDPVKALGCRPMLLDQESLNALREKDPEKYEQYFGTTTTPNFCARGGEAETSAAEG